MTAPTPQAHSSRRPGGSSLVHNSRLAIRQTNTTTLDLRTTDAACLSFRGALSAPVRPRPSFLTPKPLALSEFVQTGAMGSGDGARAKTWPGGGRDTIQEWEHLRFGETAHGWSSQSDLSEAVSHTLSDEGFFRWFGLGEMVGGRIYNGKYVVDDAAARGTGRCIARKLNSG